MKSSSFRKTVTWLFLGLYLVFAFINPNNCAFCFENNHQINLIKHSCCNSMMTHHIEETSVKHNISSQDCNGCKCSDSLSNNAAQARIAAQQNIIELAEISGISNFTYNIINFDHVNSGKILYKPPDTGLSNNIKILRTIVLLI